MVLIHKCLNMKERYKIMMIIKLTLNGRLTILTITKTYISLNHIKKPNKFNKAKPKLSQIP